MTKDDLEIVARRFRNAVERSDTAALMIGLRSFPNGACTDACILLGEYLFESGFGEFHQVCGHSHVSGQFESHCWLTDGEIIVDVTADQFADGMPQVFVGLSEWYSRWSEVTDLGPARVLASMHEHLRSDFAKSRTEICKKLV
jgi:hypothetical protein